MGASHCRFLLLLLLILYAASAGIIRVSATDHIVGGHLGWNPNINYTLWSNNQTFYVGDLISFRYQKNVYNVFEVNKTGYENCTMDGLAGNWSFGKDFVLLDKPRSYYFICGNGFCLNGMKVAVTVRPLNTTSSSSGAAAAAVAAAHSSSAHVLAPPRTSAGAWLSTLIFGAAWWVVARP